MSKFKAIVVGGGPVGMIMAHALSLADIDFVLVEKRDAISTWTGAGLVMWSQGMRILHQMGLQDALVAAAVRMVGMEYVGPGGSKVAHYPQADNENFGYSGAIFERGKFLELLFQNLPDADKKIKTSKRVSEIATHTNGVIVTFDDGTSEEGSIAIGIDGVWSTVRQWIVELAPPGTVDGMPWKADYVGAYGRCKYVKEIPDGVMISRMDNGWTFQGANHIDQFIYLVSKRTEETQAKSKYSEEDEKIFWEDLLDQTLYKDVVGRDIWNTRVASGLTTLHHGIAKSWYWDRMVMVGDANHKVTPNLGAGVVLGAEGAVVLANKLHALLQTDPNPDTVQLIKAFGEYQSAQEGRAKLFVTAGNMLLDKITWRTWFDWCSSLYVDPWLRPLLFRMVVLPFQAKAPTLDFVPFADERSGVIPWKRGGEDVPPQKSWFQILISLVRFVLGFARKEKLT